jgi:Kef-type K+ transport system membrane component KefB
MPSDELGAIALALLLLILGANVLGHLFTRLHQPRVVGEILAGVLLGPTLLGSVAPGVAADIFGAGNDATSAVLDFHYELGLVLLMFISGSSVRHLLGAENRRPTAWILGLGTPLPFVLALAAAPLLPLDGLTGPADSEPAAVLVFAVAAAVTSIPVITKIFHDLGILHTRFASLILGAAVLEDIVLWAVVAVATAIAPDTASGAGSTLADAFSVHLLTAALFLGAGLLAAPRGLRWAGRARWNVLASEAPIAWILVVLLGYAALAAGLDVTLAFAAFLAGFGIVGGRSGSEREVFRLPLGSITQVSTSVFIPVYFALVGYRLDLTEDFAPAMFLAFLVGTSVVVFVSIALAGRLAGFRGLDLVNLAITCNARGGPGIVLASVAFEAGIINGEFFTTLVLTAVVTSQACGIWLGHVVRTGRPLLAGDVRPG